MVDAAFFEGFEAHRSGRLDIAEQFYRKVLRHNPRHADTLNYLGVLSAQSGKLPEAIRLLSRAVELRGDSFEAYNNLGRALGEAGRRQEEARCYRRAMLLRPDSADLLANLADTLQELGWVDEAADAGRRAVRLNPGLARSFYTLASALRRTGRTGAAIMALQRALALQPAYAFAWSALGSMLLDQRRHAGAEAGYRRAITVDPQYVTAHSNLLLSLNYQAERSAGSVYADHRHFDSVHAHALSARPPEWRVKFDAGRRLRVGYVSRDFCEHSVAYFVGPLLAAHDRKAVEVVCYSDVADPDSLTARLRERADMWRDVVELDDQRLADLVRRDRIDILVDLAGHTEGHRLLAFARRPAPVQVTWLGYPNTTGLSAMTARLTDSMADPEGASDELASETLRRLSPSFLCYEPPVNAPDVAPLPAATSGVVTFGSFNNLAKVTQDVVALWARVLNAVPGSRLLLKSRSLGDEGTCARLAEEFAALGIGRDRLDLLAIIPDTGGHLGAYGRIDIALDPFPYNGTTTTCEALWMGVPVIARLGNRHAGRVAASILNTVGLGDLVAPNDEEYVRLALELASDRDRLAALRASLRGTVQASPLCDAKGFAQQVEGAYRALWQRACDARRNIDRAG